MNDIWPIDPRSKPERQVAELRKLFEFAATLGPNPLLDEPLKEFARVEALLRKAQEGDGK